MPARLNRSFLEILLTVLAVVWLVWLGRGVDDGGFRGEDARYQKDMALRVDLDGDAGGTGWVRSVCGQFYDYLPPDASGICADYRKPPLLARVRLQLAKLKLLPKPPAVPPRPALPLTAQAREQIRAAWAQMDNARAVWSARFSKPWQKLQAQKEALREQAALEGGDDGQEAYNKLLDGSREYRVGYQLPLRAEGAFPLPADCAWKYLSRRAQANPKTAGDATPLLALAALAAELDGERDKLPAGAFAGQPDWSAEETKRGCKGSPWQAARDGADLLDQASHSAGNADKAAALLQSLPSLRWHLAAWALCGLLTLRLGQLAGRADRLLSAALALWAVAAALTLPPLQWLGGYDFGRLLGGVKPALWLAGAAALALLLRPLRRPGPAAVPASALGYPGLVLFVGLSEWVLLDLSANGYFDNRFHGLYQQAHVFAALLLASTVPLLRGLLARWGLRVLGFWPLRMAGRGWRPLGWALAGLFATLAALLAVAAVFTAHRQLSSEIFRLCLLFGLSWFLLARADKLLSPWLRLPPAPGLPGLRLRLRLGREWLRLRLALPLLALLGFVGLGLLLTKDKGPLLVILYSGSIGFGLGLAVWLAQRVPSVVALALGMAAVPAYVWAGSFALLRFGGNFGELIGERLESAQNPFFAGNDQMAKVLWFQEEAADSGGFGLGHVPWCGELVGTVCRGVPPQIQSDYVYTALIGVFGPVGALALLALLAVWLWRLARFHLAATSGRVDSADVGQAWLSWMALCWAGLTLTQTAVTVAGNLSWLPLTGITFPLLSYGAWSLLGNALFLGLALNLNRREP